MKCQLSISLRTSDVQINLGQDGRVNLFGRYSAGGGNKGGIGRRDDIW